MRLAGFYAPAAAAAGGEQLVRQSGIIDHMMEEREYRVSRWQTVSNDEKMG